MRRRSISLTMAFLMVIASFGAVVISYDGIIDGCQRVSAEEAYELILIDHSLIVVDIRSYEEYVEGHLADAVTVPFLACSDCFLTKVQSYQQQPLLLYGDDEVLTSMACEFLLENDFSAMYFLEGGIDAWIAHGFAVEASSQDESTSGLSTEDIAQLQEQGEQEGWTFTVGENSATMYDLEDICGFVVPDNWWESATFDPCTPRGGLPDTFDWRNVGGVDYTTPVKDQGSCGSCWAFGTVGPLECNIKIKDGITVDLSEQWLVSCNRDGWGCNGGWWAHDYHQWKTDPCGGTGAVMEAEFPYVGYEAPCNCPYPHEYLIDSWAFIGSSQGIPSTNAIKQAIMDYGPVSAAVRANSAMSSYTGGIFNGCESGDVNHAVVLVGWDDNQGPSGVWFMRNSWGTGWGENGGYMRIPYGCSSIGYAACYIDYASTGGGDKLVDIEIDTITNDPAQGNFDPIDVWPFEEPEWYYRVGVEADGNTLYERNYNKDQNGNWISEHTWDVGRHHQFYVDDTTVEVTIKLMEDDLDFWFGDDLADVSAYPGGGVDDDTPEKREAIYHGTYNLETNTLTGDATGNDGGYKTTTGDGINNAKVWFKVTDDYDPSSADLDAHGDLMWNRVKPGATVTSSFTVENIGDPGSELDWNIVSWPNWGSWEFSPKSGTDLTPEDGEFTVHVEVIAPDQQEQRFDGEVKVVNTHDPTDYELIPVVLITPKSRVSAYPLLLRLFERFPHAFPLLRQLLLM